MGQPYRVVNSVKWMMSSPHTQHSIAAPYSGYRRRQPNASLPAHGSPGRVRASKRRRSLAWEMLAASLNGGRPLNMAEPDGAKWGHDGPDPTAWSECCAHYATLLLAAKEAVAESRNARHLATLRRELRRRQSDPKTLRSV